MAYNPLTPEEEYVILRKGTEMPFRGEYTNNKAAGTYIHAGAMHLYIYRKINLILIAGGPVLMMKFRSSKACTRCRW